MTAYRATQPFDIDIAPGVNIKFAYGDIVDLPQHVIDTLIAVNKVTWTDFAIPQNDPFATTPKDQPVPSEVEGDKSGEFDPDYLKASE